MSVEVLRQNLKDIKPDNIVRLICDVILPNLDKVKDHDPNVTYYRNDIVYKKDIASGKHMLYVCNADNVKGQLDLNWSEYVFTKTNNAAMFESKYVASADGITNCPIIQPLYDPDNDVLVVYHSVRGRLEAGVDWKLNQNRTSIDLQGFSLYSGEKLLYEVVK